MRLNIKWVLVALMGIGLCTTLFQSRRVAQLVEQQTERIRQLETQVQERDQKIASIEVTKDRVTTISKKNGDTIKTVEHDTTTSHTSETQQIDSQSEESDKSTSSTKSSSGNLSEYSITPSWHGVDTWIPAGISLGVRVGSTPFWTEAGWDWSHHEATLGLRAEF